MNEKHECGYLAILDALIADVLNCDNASKDVKEKMIAARKARDEI